MKPLAVSLSILGICFAPLSGAEARVRAAQAGAADRELLLLEDGAGARVRDGGEAVPLELPSGVRVRAIQGLAAGWIVAGTRTVEGATDLWLSENAAGRVAPLPTPPGVDGPFVDRPVILTERQRLVGLAWLEGGRHDALAVRAAVWHGGFWGDPVTVSGPDLASQLALAGAVLDDGSWQLVWSGFDGTDDEIFTARRRVDGSWERRRRLGPDNEVPDIQPSIVATSGGSLIAWNELHDGHYRVRLIRHVRQRPARPGFAGPAGTVLPRLLAAGDGALLLYKAVAPSLWTALELDPEGEPLRVALAAVPGYEPPVLTTDGVGARFSWPATAAGVSELEVTWESFRPELLESGAAARPASGPSMAAAGDVLYRAFGDSITRGTGWPVAPGIVFDVADDGEAPPPAHQACAQSGDPFSIRCGYNWRLEDTLDASFASAVANHGLGAETTPGGVTRIDGVLAGGGDVITIMEGSNDITGCGAMAVQTIKANVGLMVDKATAAGFDSIIASLTKRRSVDMDGNPAPVPCEDSATASLRNELATLATQKNRAFADAFSALDPALGQADYWNGGGGENDPVGHPDTSGYGKVASKFSAPILADSALAAPVQAGPSGNVGPSPTFSWNTTGNARLYRLVVTGPSAPSTQTWHDAKAVCSGSSCSASQGALGSGSYSWNVAGRNLRGLGAVSGERAFVVYASAPATAPAGTAPVGDCAGCYGNPVNVTFRFNALGDATGYDVELRDGGGVVSVESFAATSVCAMGSCSALSATNLSGGDYRWRVRGTNPAGSGPWSAFISFSIYDSVPPPPTLVSPLDETFDTTPPYRWMHTPGATLYRLVVVGGGIATNYPKSSICTGSLCEVEPTMTLAIGSYDWRVRASNPLGAGSFTPNETFEVLDCGLFPDNLDLDGGDMGSVTHRACPGFITTKAGFRIRSSETVVLYGSGGVIFEQIEVESGAKLTVKID